MSRTYSELSSGADCCHIPTSTVYSPRDSWSEVASYVPGLKHSWAPSQGQALSLLKRTISNNSSAVSENIILASVKFSAWTLHPLSSRLVPWYATEERRYLRMLVVSPLLVGNRRHTVSCHGVCDVRTTRRQWFRTGSGCHWLWWMLLLLIYCTVL